MFNRIPILALALTLAVLFSNLMMVVEAGTQRVGDECNWEKNCQSHADGVAPSWAKGKITCAVPQSNSPETCGSSDDNKSAFYGTCKVVGTLEPTEYGCGCGVHKGPCTATSPFSRIFWPQDWMKNAWAQVH
ncbi:uncharacterized protein UHOD_04531 [Ustilago sp. UG-2017b]|nr:uncharacterized protein UHOD_04531 [Ustilago sp. UG-2017b]